jgi:hypothetical protein
LQFKVWNVVTISYHDTNFSILFILGVRKYGKDFKAIADVIGTKNEAHVRLFFISYRKRYNLDAVLKEYEEENGPIPEDEKVFKIIF